MNRTIEAVFDGKVLHPSEPIALEPNTRVQLVEARGREHRMSLERGTIHARIWAPPKLFFVKTPSATAVDLGCEYTLQVDDAGAGLVHVVLGWVAFFQIRGSNGALRGTSAGPPVEHPFQ